MLKKKQINSTEKNFLTNTLENFGFDSSLITFLPKNGGYRNLIYPFIYNKDKVFNLVIFKRESNILDRIIASNKVSNYLFSLGYPTRNTILSPTNQSILRISTSTKTRYCCLYNYLPGETIPWELYTKKHIKLIGQVMGRMHRELVVFEDIDRLERIKDRCDILIHRLDNYFSREEIVEAIRFKLGIEIDPNQLYIIGKRIRKISGNETVLHMDLVRSNVLFGSSQNNLEITGIIDFEKVAYGPNVFDIARTLAFLLVDCKGKSSEKIQKYFLKSGYLKRGNGLEFDVSELSLLIRFFWIYDFYKFLLHNPYESLSENQHYLSTVEKLTSSGLIRKFT